jgi:hypothetical protein
LSPPKILHPIPLRPHRCELVEKAYFRRSGSSSRIMEHFEIEDAFNRISPPELELKFRFERVADHGRIGSDYRLVLQLHNPSRMTAKFPYLYMTEIKGAKVEFAIISSPYARRDENQWNCFYGGIEEVINPQTTSTVATFEVKHRVDTNNYRHWLNDLPIDSMNAKSIFLKFEYRHGCENTRMKEGIFEIRVSELVNV